MRQAMMDGQMLDMRSLAEAGRFWAINGTVPQDIYDTPPLLDLALGKSHIITLENRTSWVHPIHLHGHSFFVTDPRLPDGSGAIVRDTILMAPDEVTEIAFVADNPGQWMLHCHVLEHQGSGMMGTVLVG
jgi:FtsP/CotA-like multicopper oxidase with cupredoxin domain